jgi:class 3 adenylate cyclase/tetratricopeptide (TPR) repeat protein
VSDTAVTPHPGTGEPELRRVTVLFADIQGSTALIQDLDAENAAGLIDPALNAMIEAAERFDGAVSHRGDGIMAVFGAPTVAEDHALRACLAALAMHEAVAATGEAEGVRLRVGIHAGEVVFRPVRIGGALMHDAVGIAVHIAARLEQSAPAGTICISDAVRALAGSYLRTAPLDTIQVKGIDAPIARHRLLGAEPSLDRWAVRAARGLAGFVNRERERAALSDALSATGLRAVHLLGPAGIGKSRLVHEFLREAADKRYFRVALTGEKLRRFAPFHPVTAWLRARLDIRDADPPAAARSKVAAALAALGSPPEAEPPLLERLLGLGPPPDRAAPGPRIDFGGAVAGVIGALAGNRHVLLVCEDAESFDPATMELLETALPRLAGRGALLVSASRSAVRIPGIPDGSARTIAVGPLAEAEAATLLAGIDAARVIRTEPAIAAEILRKAGGNPLFLEEVAPLVAAGGPEALGAIPGRVEELIADRLGRLPGDLRRLVQLCAVVGQDVPFGIIKPLSGLDAPSLQGALSRLADEEILYESRKYPDPQFSFKHALTRDVAYRNILLARRRAHHGAIVDILAAADEDLRRRSIDDLCHHALMAQRWREAVDYLRLAAREAMARTAYAAARTALRRARDVAATLAPSAETARLRLDVVSELTLLERFSGSYAELGPMLDEAETLANELGERSRLTELLAVRVHMFNILGRLGEAIALGERTRLSARAEEDAGLLMNACFFTGQSYFNAGRLADAERLLSETVALAEVHVDRPGQSPAARRDVVLNLGHGTRAMTRALRGDFAGAAEDLAAAEPAARRSSRPYDPIFAAATGAFVAGARRAAGECADGYRLALALSEKSGIVQLRPPALAGLGHTQLMRGDITAASETLATAHRLAVAEQRWMFQVVAAEGMALASLALGEPDIARSFAAEAVERAERFGFAAFRVPALRVLGTVLAMTAGSESEGHARLRDALADAEAAGLAPEEARCHAALAAVGAPGAAAHLAEARTRHAALGLGAWGEAIADAIGKGRLPYI